MNNVLSGIPGFPTWTKVEPITKGWSRDTKFHVETGRGEKLLVRVSDASEYSRKQKEYEALLSLAGGPILMSRPVDFGTCNAGNSAVVDWYDEYRSYVPKWYVSGFRSIDTSEEAFSCGC